MISQTILNKFKDLYFTDYNVRLDDSEALEKCTQLFSVLDVLSQPLTQVHKQSNNDN